MVMAGALHRHGDINTYTLRAGIEVSCYNIVTNMTEPPSCAGDIAFSPACLRDVVPTSLPRVSPHLPDSCLTVRLCLVPQAESSVAATIATVVALVVTVDSTAVLFAAVVAIATVAFLASAALSISQQMALVSGPCPPRGRPVLPGRRRSSLVARRSSRTRSQQSSSRLAGLAELAFVRTPDGGHRARDRTARAPAAWTCRSDPRRSDPVAQTPNQPAAPQAGGCMRAAPARAAAGWGAL